MHACTPTSNNVYSDASLSSYSRRASNSSWQHLIRARSYAASKPLQNSKLPCEFTVDAPFNCGTICDGNYASKPELDVIAPGKSLQSNCESKTRCRYNIPSDASE